MMRGPLVIAVLLLWACKAFAQRRGLLGNDIIEDEYEGSPNFTMRMFFQSASVQDKMGNTWQPPGAWPVTVLSVEDSSTFDFEVEEASPAQKFFRRAMVAKSLSYFFNFTETNNVVPNSAWLRLYFSLPQKGVTPDGKKMAFSGWVDLGNGPIRILKEYTPFYYDNVLLASGAANTSSYPVAASAAYALEWYLPVGESYAGNLTLAAEVGAVMCVNGIELISHYEPGIAVTMEGRAAPMQTVLRLNLGSRNESLGPQGPLNPKGDFLGRVWQALGEDAPVADVAEPVEPPVPPFFVPSVVLASTLSVVGMSPPGFAVWSLRLPGDASFQYLVRFYFTVRKEEGGQGDSTTVVVTLNEKDRQPDVKLDESMVGRLVINEYFVDQGDWSSSSSSMKSSDDHFSGDNKTHDDDKYEAATPAPAASKGPFLVDDFIRVDVNIGVPPAAGGAAPSAGTGSPGSGSLHLEVCALEILKIGVSDLSSFQAPLPVVNAVWHEALDLEKNHKGFPIGLLVGVIVGSVVAFVVCVVLVGFLFHQWSQQWRRTKHIKTEIKRALTAPITFRFSELRKATDNFSLENELGSGGFGRVYKGLLPGGVAVAVKLLGREARTAEAAFLTEVAVVGSVRHLNLAALRGFCAEGDRRLLVYDYYQNGSVDTHLFRAEDEKRPVLPWDKRWQIACDTARALAYLHEECPDRIIHRDLKPGNILLAADWRAAVSDFGLARLGKPADTHMTVTCMAGTRGYLPPESMDKQLTSKYDVFAYGVIMLELVSGRHAVDLSKPREEVALVEWAWSLMEPSAPRPMRLVDPLLDRGAGLPVEQVETLVRLGLLCCYPDPGVRPPMSRVLQVLQGNVALPPLPARPRLEHSGFFVPTGYSSSWTPDVQFAAPQGAEGLRSLQSTGDASNTTNQSLSTPFDTDSNPNSF